MGTYHCLWSNNWGSISWKARVREDRGLCTLVFGIIFVFKLASKESKPRVAHLEWPQSDVDVSIDTVRLEHRLNGTGAERQHGLLVLVEEPQCTY